MNEETMNFEEQLLSRSASAFVYPATPQLASGVLARISAGEPPRTRAVPGWIVTRGLAAALVLLAVAAAVLVTWGDAREAVADFLGLAVEGEQIHILPTPAPGVTPTALPPERALDSYATETTLLDARLRAGFDPQLPVKFQPPIRVYTIDYAGTPVIVLQYPMFVLWEVRDLLAGKGVVEKSIPGETPTPYPPGPGIFEKGLFEKGVSRLSESTVQGRPAYWISGGPHFVRFLGRDGTPIAGSDRTVGRNTLVWRGPGGTNYRLEIDGSLEQALTIANSLP